jgi:spore maturation protein CgeB
MKKKCKVFVYMVDSPFYTKQSHFLYNLFEADMVLAIDTAWVEQLRRIGVNKVEFGIAGADTNTFYPMKPKDDEVAAYSSDLVFLGNSPSTVSGYKRALFLSKFAGLDIRIHGGPEWKKWFENFPELNGHMVFRKEPYSFEKMNTIYNCCKIAPVDTNPGLINGVHPKIFDCIASGILPIVEHRTDSEVLFSSIGLPLIKNYNQAREIAEYYLNSENERQKKILALRNFVLKEYTSLCFAKRILGYANQE